MASVRSFIKIFPAGSLPRVIYSRRMVAFYSGYHMSPEDVKACERDDSAKRGVLEKYARALPAVVQKHSAAAEALIARAPAYRDRQHDEKLREEMLFCRLAYGFEPDEFMCYGLENKSPEERKEYVSDRELMHDVCSMNDRIDIRIYNDKANTYLRFRPYYQRDAVIISGREDYDAFREYVSKHPVFVKKKVGEAMGRSVELIDLRKDGVQPDEVFRGLIEKGKHILEEKVEQSAVMAALNQSSVNTVRFITYSTRNGIVIPYSFMKIGRSGSFVDNGGAGGILVGIDQSTGRLNTEGFDEFVNRYPEHPDSKIPFMGYQLPEFDKAIALAEKLSGMTPSVKFIGWDFAHTDNGWVVIEGNGMSQLIGPQIIWENGVKREVEKIKQTMDLM